MMVINFQELSHLTSTMAILGSYRHSPLMVKSVEYIEEKKIQLGNSTDRRMNRFNGVQVCNHRYWHHRFGKSEDSKEFPEQLTCEVTLVLRN